MNTKKQFKYFSIINHEKEQDYLAKMHKLGWKFTKVTGFGIYHFEECEPVNTVYQLDYNQDGLIHKAEYIQMFKDCGWEYIQDYVGYSYFRKPASEMNGDEEIFCDDASRLEMISRVFKGRMLPLVLLFTVCLLPEFIISLFFLHNFLIGTVLGAILILYLTVFGRFWSKYSKLKKKVKNR